MNTRKKLVWILVLIVLLAGLTGCAGKGIKDAVWEEYQGKSFLNYLQDGVEGVYTDNEFFDLEKVVVKYKEGWKYSDNLEKSDVSGNNKAYTYSAHVYEEGELVYSFLFFVEYDKNKNQIIVRGAKSVDFEDYENGYEIDADDAVEALEELGEYQ